MTPPVNPRAGRQDGLLRELSEAECWAHLTAHTVGRLAYVDQDGPLIVSLNYLAQDGRIWLRTAAYNQVSLHLPGQLAAFQVDHSDEHVHTGWSVVVRGRAERPDETGTAPRGGWPVATPWADGARSMTFCLTPSEVTGRALRQADVSPGAGHGPGTIQRR